MNSLLKWWKRYVPSFVRLFSLIIDFFDTLILRFRSWVCLKLILVSFLFISIQYKQLLTYIKSAVTRNYSERSISNILDYISTTHHMDVLKDFYEITLDALQEAKNDRLWYVSNVRISSVWFNMFCKLCGQVCYIEFVFSSSDYWTPAVINL